MNLESGNLLGVPKLARPLVKKEGGEEEEVKKPKPSVSPANRHMSVSLGSTGLPLINVGSLGGNALVSF